MLRRHSSLINSGSARDAVLLTIILFVCRLWEQVVFLHLSLLRRCLVLALLQDLLFLNTLLCTLIPNLLFLWDILPTWSAIHSCLRATRICPLLTSRDLLVTTHTISLWQQCYHNTKIVFLSAVCLNLQLFPLDMPLGVQPVFLGETFLWIHLLHLRAQRLAMMMF